MFLACDFFCAVAFFAVSCVGVDQDQSDDLINICKRISLNTETPSLIFGQKEKWKEIRKYYNHELRNIISANYKLILPIVRQVKGSETQQEVLRFISGPLYLGTYPVAENAVFTKKPGSSMNSIVATEDVKSKQGVVLGQRKIVFTFQYVEENWLIQDICTTFDSAQGSSSCVFDLNSFFYGKLQ